MKRGVYLGVGIAIVVILALSYFITITITDGNKITETPLLGIIMFYNPFVLGFYILISVVLVVKGLSKKGRKKSP